MHFAKTTRWWLWGILLCATVIRLWGIDHQIYTDENKVVTPSVRLVQGAQEPLLYPQGSYYPHFYHYVLAVSFLPVRIAGAEYPSLTTAVDAYTLMARVITAFLGVATVGIVFLIGKHLGGVSLGMLAALLLAFLPLHVKYSHYAHVDIPLALIMTAALGTALKIEQTGRPRWYIWTGILVGLSGATHYPGFVIGSALVIAHLLWVLRNRTKSWRGLFLPAFIASLLLIPVTFAVASPYTLIKWREALTIYQQLNQRGAAGDLGYTRPDFVWPLYTDSPDWGLPFTSGGFMWEMHPIMFGAALVGILFTLWNRNWKLLLLIGGTAFIIYGALVYKLPLYAVKRLLPLTPLIALLAAYSFRELVQLPTRLKPITVVVSLTGMALITLQNITVTSGFAGAYAGGSTHSQAVTWAEQNIPQGSTVLQHAPIRLLNWDDARFTTVRLNEVYANFNKDDPEVSHDRARPLEYWVREQGIDFIAMDSRIVDRYFDATSIRLYPETTASYQAFYKDIERRGTLIFEVTPELWRIAGPKVRIYDVRALRS
jgi:4-amino-4-deoxy-L-arabinose transferase-like glycosyltransferase